MPFFPLNRRCQPNIGHFRFAGKKISRTTNLRLQSSFSDNHKITGHRCVLVVLIDYLYIYILYIYKCYSKVNLASSLETLLCSLSLFLFPRLFFILPDPLPQNKNRLGKRTTHPATFPSFCAWERWQEGKLGEIKFTLQPKPHNTMDIPKMFTKPALQKRTHSTRRSSTKKYQLQLASWETGIMTTIGRGWKVIKAFPGCIAQEKLHIYMCMYIICIRLGCRLDA